MSETCEICGLELASVETRNLLHAGELVRYGEYRGKCVRDASCLQRGYEREKARADAAEAILAEYRVWSPSRTDLIEALASARRENQRLVQMIEDLRAGAVEHGLKCSIWPDDPGHHANFCGSFNGENCPLCAALAAPAAGEEGKHG